MLCIRIMKHFIDLLTAADVKEFGTRLQITTLKKLQKQDDFVEEFMETTAYCTKNTKKYIVGYITFTETIHKKFLKLVDSTKDEFTNYLRENVKNLAKVQTRLKTFQAYKKSLDLNSDTEDEAEAEPQVTSSVVPTEQVSIDLTKLSLQPTKQHTDIINKIRELLQKINDNQKNILDLTDIKKNAELTKEYAAQIEVLLSMI